MARLLLVTLLAGLLSGCAEAGRLAQVVPRAILPDRGPRLTLLPPTPPHPGAQLLPPAQDNSGFDCQPAGRDAQGRLLFRIRIQAGGSPALVAFSKLTPLFQVDGMDAPSYVAQAYFQANPGRTATSIQPGDEFTLVLPPDAFVVRSQHEQDETLGLPARVRDYVSEQGDRLRYVLTEPFPIRYEEQRADSPGHVLVHLSPDLAFLLGAGRVDARSLAQLLFRVEDPDIFQMEATSRLIGGLQPGAGTTVEIDRSRTYLDPVREALSVAQSTEPVSESARAYLTRAIMPPDQRSTFLAVEDAVGMRDSLDGLPPGQVIRIEYHPDGVVRVVYRTGEDDGRGRRDPFLLRENERWATLYQRLEPNADPPIKWGPGEPSDLPPFPTARDPYQRNSDPQHAYDYLVPGRVLVATFYPVRYLSNVRAQLELRVLLHDLTNRYRDQLDPILEAFGALETRAGVAESPAADTTPRTP
ncbi:MAG: hypothetical protein IT307_12460 [Chloroflexi bacterium]|nr:hypothetical protein [Chloroflexota bacterium]